MTERYENDMRSMMKTDYKDEKLSKENELNQSMSIDPQAPDKLERKLKSLKSQNNE